MMTRDLNLPSHLSSNARCRFASHAADCVSRKRPARSRNAGYSRETVLLSCFGLMLALLALTAFVSRMYHKEVHVLADEWFAQGETAFRTGHPAEAAKDYRNALAYSPSNPVFQLHLAEALTAARKDKEARSYLLNLLAESPGSGEINLDLARISARSDARNAPQDAMRYYYGAIYGVWSKNPLQMRWDARRELCEYFLAHRMTQQAQSEIIILAQDVPPGDPARQKQAAALLMRVQLWNQALEEYRAILVTHRRDEEALAGAGSAAFQARDYAGVVRYLDQLPQNKRDPEISARLDTARQVQAANPFLAGLPNQERVRRTVKALAQAQALLRSCPQPPGGANAPSAQAPAQNAQVSSADSTLQKLQADFKQKARAWSERAILRNPPAIDAAMAWVFQVEKTAAQLCAPSQNHADRALLLIAQSHASPGL